VRPRDSIEVSRFAPSATGRAHPGTLIAALLCWLDARSRGARVGLRLEDLDPDRVRPEWVSGLTEDLAWFGLDWDFVERQSELGEQHSRALDQLAERGLLYACRCSRSQLRESARRAPDGSYRYPGSCRERGLPAGGWRNSTEAVRVRLPEEIVDPRDEALHVLAGDPSVAFGDPIVRRRDGAIAYHLASVVDDAASGVTRVVRGRDLAPATLIQVALQRLLGLAQPTYRHHLLLLERTGRKLAKFHGAVSVPDLKQTQSAESLCGFLASVVRLRSTPVACRPHELVAGFDWRRVDPDDQLLRWDGRELHWERSPAMASPDLPGG